MRPVGYRLHSIYVYTFNNIISIKLVVFLIFYFFRFILLVFVLLRLFHSPSWFIAFRDPSLLLQHCTTHWNRVFSEISFVWWLGCCWAADTMRVTCWRHSGNQQQQQQQQKTVPIFVISHGLCSC